MNDSSREMKQRDTYIYPAIFDYAEDGISVEFPDLPGCITCGDTDEEAIRMAEDALELYLYTSLEDGEALPLPTPAKDIACADDQVVVLVRANMLRARIDLDNTAVKKTLTIPRWLNTLAVKEGVNFSQALQAALKEILHVEQKKSV